MRSDIAEKIPVLFDHCRRLLEFSHSMLTPRTEAARADHAAFMLITFAAKQMLHSESMGVLASGGCYADMAIVARAMLDGYTLLKWSLREPVVRPLAWRSYSLVMDYQLLQQNRMKGMPIDESYEQELLARLDEHGVRFLRRSNGKGERQYHSRWHVGDDGKLVTLQAMMGEIGSIPLYEFYDEWSAWSHWNPRGIGGGMHETDAGFALHWDREEAAAGPLGVSFQCLLETLEAMNAHLKLGHAARLSELRADFVRDLMYEAGRT